MRFERSTSSLLPVLFMFVGIIASSSSASAAGRPGAPVSGTPQTVPGLGTASFPTSTNSSEAQTAFLRGLLLLHLFEYPEAAKSFVAAEKLDHNFAMAYWGEAMTFNHGVWDQVDVAAGKAALDKLAPTAAARAGRIADPRARAYMAAVELLYDGTGTKAERDLRYSQAMERLSIRYPGDRNAQLFYALALLSQSEGVRDVPVYLHAAAIAKSIFRLEPNNPGAAHYWIHGMDDPEHAAGALEAARALSKIAPDAGHAQHMCSHIFMALGMWDDVVQRNVAAMRVVNQEDTAGGLPLTRCSHYQQWLEYGYFQQGRLREAKRIVLECEQSDGETMAWMKAHPGQPLGGIEDSAHAHRDLVSAYARARNMAVIESRYWNGAPKAAFDTAVLHPYTGAWYEFANGIAAAERGDLIGARSALEAMHTETTAFRSGHDVEPQDVQTLSVGTDELSGFIQVKDGQYEAGIAEMRHAAETYRSMAFAFGPPVTIKPPEELLGDVLLGKGDAAGARRAFELSLQRAPKRTQSLLGLARAEHRAGEDASARKTYQTLMAIWHQADARQPGLEEARKALYSHAEIEQRH